MGALCTSNKKKIQTVASPRKSEELKEPLKEEIEDRFYFSKEEEEYYEAKQKEFTDFKEATPKKAIKNCQKGEKIGEGSYGRVFKAFEQSTGRIIALKEIDTGLLSSQDTRALNDMETEIKIMSSLSHPNIVRYYGTERKTDCLHIFLEFCVG